MSLFFHSLPGHMTLPIPGHCFTSLPHYPCTFAVAEVVPEISALTWIFWTLLSDCSFGHYLLIWTVLPSFDSYMFGLPSCLSSSTTWTLCKPALFIKLKLHQPTCLFESFLLEFLTPFIALYYILYCTILYYTALYTTIYFPSSK